ncbi:MAG: tetratricopeptide repeat protein [Pseudomonadales bacterium]|nr:tetratricopeptide repeat protein [Pseudomonadales bacterium]MCP5330980.1 tetratricopeptide repeat protein [Pseudomonadales bacterium]MCP5344610.1 tetratricopeptide repeat protein [Pseudomonadales bacterium]
MMRIAMPVGRILTTVVLGLLLSACNIIRLDMNFTDDRRYENRILNQQQDSFADVDPMALNQEIIDYIEAHVRNRSSATRIVDQLQRLLFDPEFLNIEYDEQVTRTAIATFEDRRGNCLSVVNLYIAMARHFGVDARFQTVKVRPNWDRRGEMLVLSQHINAIGRLSQNTLYVVDFTPEITLQQLTASTIDDREARALYFNNLGVEALIVNDYETAQAYFRNALYLDPDLSIAWNNIATSFSRMNEKDIAEYAYRKAYSLDRSNATAINNLVKYYNNIGDIETAQRYSKAIERFNNSNPYYHYTQGNIAYADGNYELARDNYQRAIERKNSEPDFYLALGKTYEQLGNAEEATRMVDVARLIVLTMGDIYLPSRNKMRVVDEKSILRPTSAGISIETKR